MATLNAMPRRIIADHPDLKVNELSLGLTKRPSMIRDTNSNSKLNGSQPESKMKRMNSYSAPAAAGQLGE
jgi:hypothetical protein